jgi:diguanylate cyclase
VVIVSLPVAGARTSELIRAADICVGWAQTDEGPRSGGGRWAVFDEERNAAEVLRHRMTADMPAALARHEFTLAYQPLVRLSDSELVGVEALARWNHGTFGPVSPMRFIAAAEDTGLIVPLGLELLERACAQAVAWRWETGRTPTISVNLAVAQLREPGLLADVLGVLRRTGLGAEDLQLEITETALIDSGDDAVDILQALAQEGIRLAIDDFGTGYSSLAYLAELPVHNLKLAARFLHGIDPDAPVNAATGRSNRTILPALVSLAHELDMTVTAEGIETAAQADHLRELGCDFGQGYMLGRPMAALAVADLLH